MKFYIIFVLFFINVRCQETTCSNEGCPVLYDPVCAGPVFGVDKLYTFKNLCYLDSYNCKRLRKYEVKYQGLCYPK